MQNDILTANLNMLPFFVSVIVAVIFIYLTFKQSKDLSKAIAQNNQLKIAFDSIKEGMIMVDQKGQVLAVNQAILSLFNLSINSILGKNLSDIITISQDNKQIYTSDIIAYNAQDQSSSTIEKDNLKILTISNKAIQANLVSSITPKAYSKGIGSIITIYDQSQQSDQDNKQLDFVLMAVHELRSPLTSIKDYLSVFMNDYAKSLNSDQNTILGRIKASADNLAKLIEDLLNVVKIDKNNIDLQFEQVDWVKNVNQQVEDLQNEAKIKQIELVFQNPDQTIPKLRVDLFRINQVISNLLTNALNYTPKGGKVELSLQLSNHLGKTFVVTNITDNGIGIGKDDLAHLFTKFYRASKQSIKGTGLGLYISKSIVTMHQGFIWVKSEPNKGSTFSFALPVSD